MEFSDVDVFQVPELLFSEREVERTLHGFEGEKLQIEVALPSGVVLLSEPHQDLGPVQIVFCWAPKLTILIQTIVLYWTESEHPKIYNSINIQFLSILIRIYEFSLSNFFQFLVTAVVGVIQILDTYIYITVLKYFLLESNCGRVIKWC